MTPEATVTVGAEAAGAEKAFGKKKHSKTTLKSEGPMMKSRIETRNVMETQLSRAISWLLTTVVGRVYTNVRGVVYRMIQM